MKDFNGSLPDNFHAAVAALRAGELVVFPTETFYAIGADPMQPAALERIFAVKGREPGKPIALIAADSVCALALAREIPASAQRLAARFWPGPLTLVLPAHARLASALIGPDSGVGVRVSPHPTALALARATGGLITATSANRSGEPPARTIAQARASLGPLVTVYLDGGTLTGAAASTVVGFEDDGTPRVLRNGAIEAGDLTKALEGLK